MLSQSQTQMWLSVFPVVLAALLGGGTTNAALVRGLSRYPQQRTAGVEPANGVSPPPPTPQPAVQPCCGEPRATAGAWPAHSLAPSRFTARPREGGEPR